MTPLSSITGERTRELFSILAYDADTHLYLFDDPAMGFGFLCQPLPCIDNATADRLLVLANMEWPTDTLVQVSLWSSPDVEEQIAAMVGQRMQTSDALLREAAWRSADFLRAGTHTPLTGTDIRLRDLQVLITAKLPIQGARPSAEEVREAGELCATAQQVLATTGLRPAVLSADRYVRILQAMLNWRPDAGWRDRIKPECDPTQLIRDQLFDYDSRVMVDARGISIGEGVRAQTFSVKRFPDRGSFGMAARYLGDPFSGDRGIRHNVLLSLNLYFPGAEALRVGVSAGAQWAASQSAGGLTHYLPRLAQCKRDYDILIGQFDRGDRPLLAYFGAVLFTPPEDAQAAGSNLRTYWRELGFQLMHDAHFSLPLLLNCLPFGGDLAIIKPSFRYRTLAASHAVMLMPVFGDWKGAAAPVMNLVGRTGQLMQFDLFESASNYNAVIAAASGSGKSFLANELLANTLAVGGRCWVIDVGRSYEKLCDALDGQFIAFTRESGIVLNPFDLIADWNEEADIIAALVSAMAAPTEPLGDYRTAGLKRVLKELWEARGRAMDVDAIAAALQDSGDARLADVGAQLFPFTSAGEYGHFFKGANTVSFDRRLVVLELEELKGRKHLQQVILLALIFQIQQEMYRGELAMRKLVLIDEAWDLLTKGDVGKFIEEGYRRFRKYGGSAVAATQSLADLYLNATGRTIADNSAHTLLLSQPAHSIDQLAAEKRLPMNEAGIFMLKTVHTVPGRYSEILINSDQGAGVGRLIVDPFRQLLYSTRPADVAAIKRLRAQGLTVADAINQLLAQRQPHGAAA